MGQKPVLSNHCRTVLSCALALALSAQMTLPACALSTPSKGKPSGTLLIPISPKIDDSAPADSDAGSSFSDDSSVSSELSASGGPTSSSYAQAGQRPSGAADSAATISAEEGLEAHPDSQIDRDTVLKGTIQMIADDTEYDKDHNTFLGTGNAVVIIAGENSRLEADTILYDETNQIIDARGNVKIYRNGDLTMGSSFKFNVDSNEYLMTNPDTEMDGTTVIAKRGYGNRAGLAFKNGNMQLSNVLRIVNQPSAAPMTYDSGDRAAHPDAYLPVKPGYRFTARKMVYERYKESGNLTVFGGKLLFGSFGVPLPLPRFNLTVGQENSRVVFPVTPMITNNLQMGGTSLGPSFNFAEGKSGVLMVSPLWQFGGSPIEGAKTRTSGPAVRITYKSAKTQFQFAYGSVSNFAVASYKYYFNKSFKIQAGINRYLEDGLFGVDRARLRGEVVHNKAFSRVPYFSTVGIRSAAGWYQDNPALINQTPSLAKLYTVRPFQGKEGAFRISEQLTAQTHPIFNLGDERWGTKLSLFGGAAMRMYSTGDHLALAQAGPVLDVRLNRLRFRTGYTQSVFNGHSPFVFDQFIQGSRSVYIGGDYKITNFLTVGGTTGYSLTGKAYYQKTIACAIGPDDFKVLLSRDIIHGINRYGFDILFGQSVPFNKLVVKGGPDQGQLGGI